MRSKSVNLPLSPFSILQPIGFKLRNFLNFFFLNKLNRNPKPNPNPNPDIETETALQLNPAAFSSQLHFRVVPLTAPLLTGVLAMDACSPIWTANVLRSGL